jgi:mRNA-degrading endonuclease RelE of RelBE toxin-antitoxin system
MADRILKFLRKQDRAHRLGLEKVMALILSGDTAGLDIKKLKGSSNIYRARVGQNRIIFSINNNGLATLIDVKKRDDQTYRDY